MGNARGDLTDRGEFFRNDELLGGRLKLLVGDPQFPCTFFHPGVELFVPFTQLALAFLQLIEQLVQVRGHTADLVPCSRQASTRSEVTTLHLGDRVRHALQRPEDRPRPAQEDRDADSSDEEKGNQDGDDRGVFRPGEGRLQEAHVEHADTLLVTVHDGFVGRDVPVIDNKSAFEPGLAVTQHRSTHRSGNARTERTHTFEQAHIGADAHIVKEQGSRAVAALRQGIGAVDQIVDGVDEIQIAVQQQTTDQRRRLFLAQGNRGGRMHHHAAHLRVSVGWHRVGRRHQLDTCALGQFGIDVGEFSVGEDVDGGERRPRQRRSHDGPIGPYGGRDKMWR